MVASADGVIDTAATTALRAQMALARPPIADFDFGPPIAELKANCLAETGLEPPVEPVLSRIATAWMRRNGIPIPATAIAAE